MTPDQATALATLTLFAAFADGTQSDPERASVKDVITSLGNPNLSTILRTVVFKETTPAAQAALLDTEELRNLAWESALTVIEADGATSPAERTFLDDLATHLKRPLSSSQNDIELANSLHHNPTLAPIPLPPLPPLSTLPAVSPLPQPAASDPRLAETDATVLKYAILTAAVELLPQNLATLAIIPLQTKMVHGIGNTFGHSLSTSSIKEFVATIGIGMTGQVIEQHARKLLGSLAGRFLGGLGKTAVNWSTGPALTFATTYSMGMVAKQYYAGGRTLSAINLRTLYAENLERAKTLYTQYEPQIQQTARTTHPTSLLQSLRA